MLLNDPMVRWPRPRIELFKWSAHTVEKELGTKREVFLRAAVNADIAPDSAGHYTSKQVFRALTSDSKRKIEAERLALLTAERKLMERGERLEGQELVVRKPYEEWIKALLQCISAAIMNAGPFDQMKAASEEFGRLLAENYATLPDEVVAGALSAHEQEEYDRSKPKTAGRDTKPACAIA